MVVDPLAAIPQAPLQQAASPESAGKPTGVAGPTDLFDYVMQHGASAVGFDGLSRTEQANRLANPATLGDRILSGLDGFAQRSKQIGQSVANAEKPVTTGGPGIPAGPASAPVTPEENFRQSIVTLGDIFNFAIETQLVERSSSTATNALTTLVKGQ